MDRLSYVKSAPASRQSNPLGSDGHVHWLVQHWIATLLEVFQRDGGGKQFGAFLQGLRSPQIKRLVAGAQGVVGEPAQGGRERQQNRHIDVSRESVHVQITQDLGSAPSPV